MSVFIMKLFLYDNMSFKTVRILLFQGYETRFSV